MNDANREPEKDWSEVTDDQWKKQLSDHQFHVARRGGTERAFTGEYHDCKDSGTYKCVCCGAPLFSSEEKYDSGSGWPSFWQPLDQAAVETETEADMREEVHCVRCKAHLGHVFPDGPNPTGLRYCINSASLELEKDNENQSDNT